jgi:hypothetical protein
VSLRIPLSPDQTLQTEFHEIERRLRRLEKRTGTTAGNTTIQVLGGGAAQPVNLTSILNRLDALEAALAAIPDPDEFDIAVFGAVGTSSATGVVPAPGVPLPPTGVAQHLLTENATWGFPLRGLIGVATPGTQTDPPYDVVTLSAGLHAQNAQVSELECHNLHVNGQVEYQDTFWEDLRFPTQGINPLGTAAPPAIDTSDPYGGTFLFDAAGTDVIAGIAQMPHEWKAGTAIHPHIHWMPTDANAGDVAWRLSYQIADINEDFPGVLTTAGIEIDAADGSAVKHQIHFLTNIDMTGYKESCIMVWKIERVGGDLSDSYGADARFLEFDIHYEISKPGTTDPNPP